VAVVHHLDLTLEELLAKKPVLLALIDQGRDPGNLGSIIRAADAAGADGIVLSSDSVDVYNPKVIRTTAGSILNVPIVVSQDLSDAIAQLKLAGIQVFSSSASGEDVTQLSVTEMAKPTAWIFGNEAHGVTSEVAESADKTLSLPIYGAAESLNLGTAASICLYFTAVAQHTNR
jgi:TrmH family RNA methyltransferase